MEDKVYKNIQEFLKSTTKDVDEYVNAIAEYEFYLGELMKFLQEDEFEHFMSENEPLNTVDYVNLMISNYELPKGIHQIIPIDSYTRATDIIKQKLIKLGYKDED